MEKIKDLELLFIHMHHLINEFRPHQARETLRVMLHVQKRKRLQLAEKFQGHLEKVQETIQEALDALPDQEDSETAADVKGKVQDDSNSATDQIKGQENMLDAALCEIVGDVSDFPMQLL